MTRSVFSVLKMAVVVMMLVWIVRTASAGGYPTCGSKPKNPTMYSSCMSTCGNAQSSCVGACNVEFNVAQCNDNCVLEYNCAEPCEEQNGYQACAICEAGLNECQNECNTMATQLQSCVTKCTNTFDTCATTCYNSYCI